MDQDRNLVEECQRASREGFEIAFGGLYQRYKDRVYNVAFRITGNGADALDAAQETFGILFRKIRHFRFDSKFSSWVYRIAVNASIDLRRRNAARRLPSLEEVGSGSLRNRAASAGMEEVSDPEAAAAGRELEDQVHRSLETLSPKLRAMLVLRHVEGLAYEEIAEVLGCSLGTVKSRLARAHEAIAKSLGTVIENHYMK